MLGSRNDRVKGSRAEDRHDRKYSPNCSRVQEVPQEFIARQQVWLRGQRKGFVFYLFFHLKQGLILFLQLFKREKGINVFFMLPKGDFQEPTGLAQDMGVG